MKGNTMLTFVFLALGIVVMFGSLFTSAFLGTQLAVLGVGVLMIAVILELRKLNSFNDARKKAAQNRQSVKEKA